MEVSGMVMMKDIHACYSKSFLSPLPPFIPPSFSLSTGIKRGGGGGRLEGWRGTALRYRRQEQIEERRERGEGEEEVEEKERKVGQKVLVRSAHNRIQLCKVEQETDGHFLIQLECLDLNESWTIRASVLLKVLSLADGQPRWLKKNVVFEEHDWR
ncbi:hypothetical protein FQA47_001698 [Oryzias melastigma]|uniref:Uncharacterized protein n=1 Tax=Oryzias melastigma TaxID=30732 RepID=A0A834FJH8_ORYME|nr:hypothetical protein FQA47_001698 [Oryzias melastigma]